MRPPLPAEIAERLQATLTLEQVRKRIAYDRALNPPRRVVSAHEFEQLVYDAIWANRATSPAQIRAALAKRYEIAGGER